MMSTLFPTSRPRIYEQVGQKLVEIQQQIGAGAFGARVVYQVKDVATSNEYALKTVVCNELLGIEGNRCNERN